MISRLILFFFQLNPDWEDGQKYSTPGVFRLPFPVTAVASMHSSCKLYLNERGTNIFIENVLERLNCLDLLDDVASQPCLQDFLQGQATRNPSRILAGRAVVGTRLLNSLPESPPKDVQNIPADLNVNSDRRLNNAFLALKCSRSKHPQNIFLGNLNINSIRNKFESIEEIISGIFDIFLTSESKLDSSFPSNQFSIDGYRIFRMDRNKHGGGLMFYVNQDMSCKILSDFEFFIGDRESNTRIKPR